MWSRQLFVLLIYKLFTCFVYGDEQNIIGKDCKLTEPIYNNTFDLSSLHSVSGNSVQVTDNIHVDFNVCGNLTKACGESKSAAACLHKQGKEIAIGSDSEKEPIYLNGRLYFNFTGDICKKETNEKYNLVVTLICDYSKDSMVPSISTEFTRDNSSKKDEDACRYTLFWPSKIACLPLSKEFENNTCTVKDDKTGYVFNLMPLSQVNHKITYDKGDFLINICKPTLYGYNEMCPPNSSVCFSNSSITDVKAKFKNFGTVVPQPTFQNNKLFMKLESNETCKDNEKYSSLINFICDTSVPSNAEQINLGEPKFLDLNKCQYRFNWVTSLACNEKQFCQINDPRTGDLLYNLRSLAGKSYKVKYEGREYQFGICGAAKAPCLENAGACNVTGAQTSSLGVLNETLSLSETKLPYLEYQSGAVCEQLHQHWTTKIEFVCNKNGFENGPKVIEDTKCQLIIQFPTDLVCRTDISCKAYDHTVNRELDLAPLISSTGNYLARVNDTIRNQEDNKKTLYYLNVCRPLVPQYGLSCSGDSAACRAINGTITPEQEQSLGTAVASLTLVNTEHGTRPQLKYFGGSTCPKDTLSKLSSQIEFYCDPKAGKGTPILQEILDSCHYVFHWPTNVICKIHDSVFREKECEIYNDQVNKTTDLKTIFKDGSMNVKYGDASHTINICKNNQKVETDYARSIVSVFFNAKIPCNSSDTINVEVRLICKDSESETPLSAGSCSVVITKETPLICPQLGIVSEKSVKPNATINTDTKAKESGISAFGAVLILITFIAFVLASVYLLKNPDRRNRILSLFRKRNVAVQYTRDFYDEN